MQQLKKRISKGDPEAFVELYELFGDRMLRFLSGRLGSSDASDVMQEVFVRLFRYRRKLGKAKNLEAYVFLTVRNEAIRWVNRHQKHVHGRKPLIEPAVRPSDRGGTAERVQSFLTHVSGESREIIELKIFSGLTFAMIGDILKLPAATVATKYRRAIQKMQEQITMAGESIPKADEDEYKSELESSNRGGRE